MFGVSSWKLCVFVNLICFSRLPALQLTPLPLKTSVNRTHALHDQALERARRDRAVHELLLRFVRLRVKARNAVECSPFAHSNCATPLIERFEHVACDITSVAVNCAPPPALLQPYSFP